MSIKATSEAISELEIQLLQTSVSLEDIRPSNEFLQILKTSHTFSIDLNQFSKTQIKTMEKTMSKLFSKVNNLKNAKLDDIVTLAHTYYNVSLGYIRSEKKANLSIAKEFVQFSLNLIKDKELDAKSILIILKSYHNLGFIYYKQKKVEKAVQMYNKGIEFYLTYTQNIEEYGSPIDCNDLISELHAEINTHVRMSYLYVYILEKLINMHKIRLINDQSLMIYVHMLLVAEMDNLSRTEEYFCWITKAMELCDYLITYNHFKEARNYIIAANNIKGFLDKKYNDTKEQGISSGKSELFSQQTKAAFNLLNMYRAKYGITLLRRSAERLLQLEKDEDSDTNSLKLEFSRKFKQQTFIEMNYENLTISIHDKMTANYITNYVDAQQMFVNILRYFYNVEQLTSNMNVEVCRQIILETSKAYKYMALYEKNTSNQILLQNRRVQFLLDVINITRPLDSSLCGYLQLQLAITYATLINIKFESLETVHPLYTPGRYNTAILEINSLVDRALFEIV